MTAEEIKYLLSKKGLKLSDLDKANSFRQSTCSNAIKLPHVKAEKVIAKALNKHPMRIWPERYNAKGKRLKPQPYKNYTYQKRQLLNDQTEVNSCLISKNLKPATVYKKAETQG